MNADIQGMLDYFKHRQMNCLQSDKGEVIPTKEAKEYLRWCLKHGYKELKDAPDWDEYLKMRKKK